MSYNYNYSSGRLVNNRLNYLAGNGNATHFGPVQSANNYMYDAIGNLTADNQAHVSGINWSVYGKIQSLTDSAGSVTYNYNTAQQRISKVIGGLTTWYVRDAQGNTLALYDNKASQTNWREQHLYGSSRLGLWNPNVNLATNNASTVWDTIGKKSYELSNHLGNVMATITDARTSHSGYYTPNIIASQDYYAFGALMPGRASSSSTYRYGFNGKENDNEVKGTGNQQDYGQRIYDPRIGRFNSVDPLSPEYPWNGSYNFSEGDPISNIDLDGLEKQNSTGFFSLIGQGLHKGYDETKNSIKNTFSTKTLKAGLSNIKAGAVNFYGMSTGDANAARAWGNGVAHFSIGISNTVQSYTSGPIIWATGIPGRSREENLRGLGYGLYKSMEVGSLFVVPEFGEADVFGKSSVDMMGGEISSLGSDFINFDRQARFGISDDIGNFSKYFGKSSVERMIANNPQAEFLPAVSQSVESGGTITIRGQMNNKFFKEIWTGKAKGLEDFEIVPGSRKTGLSTEGYTQSNGAPLRGDPNSLNEITLKKKPNE